MKLLLFPAGPVVVYVSMVISKKWVKSNYCSHQTSVEKSANWESPKVSQHPGGAGSLEAQALSQVRLERNWFPCSGSLVYQWGIGWVSGFSRSPHPRQEGCEVWASRWRPFSCQGKSPTSQVRKGLQWLSSSSVPRQEPLRFRLRFVFFKLKKIDIRQYYNMNQSRSFFIFSITSNSLFYPQSCFK